MIRNRDIVIVGLQPWDSGIGSNCKNIALEFARHNRVLYVNHPLDRVSKIRSRNDPAYQNHFKVFEQGQDPLVPVAKNIWALYPVQVLESINWIPFTPLFRIFNKVNNRRFARDIRKGIERLGFKNYILFNDSDMFRSFHLKELLSPVQSIYYSRDNLMGVPYWHRHGQYLEPELFAKSDLVVANSTYLSGIAEQHNPRSYYVGQGCEVEAFDPEKVRAIPGDIAGIPSPVIGYIGALFDLRLDIALLESLAGDHPGWQFVFIGPEDEAFRNSRLHQMPHVHFLGLKEVKDLPAYLSRFDVALNPQKVNEVTIGNYPRKIDEYLAMGKAVVATETAAMSIFRDHVYFAGTAEDYARQIEKALKENTREKEQERIAFAQSHTWENSVAEIYRAMLEARPEWRGEVEDSCLQTK
ncbi:MAG: glycosyltransferase [Flavisolibacter sp.]